MQACKLIAEVNEMPKEWDINDKRFIQIGLKIAYYRKMNEMTQDQLAERIGITSKYLSQVETPSCVQPVSLKTLFAIADLFHIPPHKFLEFEKE